MAVRIKVSKSTLIKAIEKARDAKVAEFAAAHTQKKTTFASDTATWRKTALARLAEATKQVRDGTFINAGDGWRDTTYINIPRKPRPEDYERNESVEAAKKRIAYPYDEAIKRISLSIDDVLTISEKDDYFRYI